MDLVVKKNADNAEESASASQELNFQADQLQTIVTELLTLVSGANGRAEGEGKPGQPLPRLLGWLGKNKEHTVPGRPPAPSSDETYILQQPPHVEMLSPEETTSLADERLENF